MGGCSSSKYVDTKSTMKNTKSNANTNTKANTETRQTRRHHTLTPRQSPTPSQTPTSRKPPTPRKSNTPRQSPTPSQTPTSRKPPTPRQSNTTRQSPTPSQTPTSRKPPTPRQSNTTRQSPTPSQTPTSRKPPTPRQSNTPRQSPTPSQTPTSRKPPTPRQSNTTRQSPTPSQTPTSRKPPTPRQSNTTRQSPTPRHSRQSSISFEDMKENNEELQQMQEFERCIETSQTLTWDDIAGQESIKEQINDTLVLPYKYPGLFTDTKPTQGLLLYGPPGTGKTMFAKAIAAQCNFCFLNVQGCSIVSKWVGDSAKNIKVLFKMARSKQPAIIYIDEIDCIGSKRGGGHSNGHGQMLAQLLTELDGFTNDNIIIIGSTNCPWLIDEALMRRLGEKIYVPLPHNDEQRKKILRKALCKRRLEFAVNILAAELDGYSPDDIIKLSHIAMREAAKRYIKYGITDQLPEIIGADMRTAMSKFKPSVSEECVRQFTKYQQNLNKYK